MVEPGRRRLNPPQPALSHHLVPRHGHLRVAAKHVGRQQLLGDPFLAGVDDLELRRDGRNLGDVPRFDRVTQDDPLAAAGRWRCGADLA